MEFSRGHRGVEKLAEKRLEKQEVEPWVAQRVQELLRAQGRIIDFRVEDIPEDELREKIKIVAHSRRMRYADNAISTERSAGLNPAFSSRRFIWEDISEMVKGGSE